MKVSISLPDEDVELLDTFVAERGFRSRSAVVHKAVRLLRAADLGTSYEDAFTEWEASGDAGVWEPATGDGITV